MKKLIAISCFLLMCGCASQQPNFYQPVAIKTAEVSYPNFKGIVLLPSVIMPAEVSRPQITTIGKTNYELKIDEFNRWGASPDKLIQTTLNQDLSFYLPSATIENQTSLRKNYKYAVAVEVTELGGKLDERANFSASYYIKNEDGKIIKTGEIKKSMNIRGGYSEYVEAQSQMIGNLAAKIATDLSKL